MIQCSTEVREFELDRHSVLWRSFGGALSGVSGARESVEEGRGGVIAMVMKLKCLPMATYTLLRIRI